MPCGEFPMIKLVTIYNRADFNSMTGQVIIDSSQPNAGELVAAWERQIVATAIARGRFDYVPEDFDLRITEIESL